MTAQQWFSLRMSFKERGSTLVVLKKRELSKFLFFQNRNFSVDADNSCLTFLNNLNLFLKHLNSTGTLTTSNLRFFLLKISSQILTTDYLKNFLIQKDITSSGLFNNNFMFLQKTFLLLKCNVSSSIFLFLTLKNLTLKE